MSAVLLVCGIQEICERFTWVPSGCKWMSVQLREEHLASAASPVRVEKPQERSEERGEEM